MKKINSSFDINNKIAIITGTSRGIGYSLAKGFIDSGAFVHGLSRSGSNLSNQENYTDHKIDLKDKSSINTLISKIGKAQKKCDILINCAGISIPLNKSSNVIGDYFQETLDINLLSNFYLSSAVSELMKKQKSGSIINVSSIGANLGFPSNPAYISSKAGLSGLTRSLSYDLAKFGIRVNNLVPGYFLTDMTKESFSNPEKQKERSSRSLLSRWGDPEELIGPAIFLASSASSFITGIDLVVDGGWSIKGI
tara:strand:- start:392 stop:1147 length:756 start_codon:yes stop_codon:yes gene_type:complete